MSENTECVILYRCHNGDVDFVRSNADPIDIEVFPNFDTAVKYADSNHLFEVVPYMIVELIEL